MQIIITGASGQVGRTIQDLWNTYAHKNISVAAFSRNDLDITNVDAISRTFELKNPDLVLNLAAFTNVTKAEKNNELAVEVNANGVFAISQQCHKANIPMIHISTDFVFDGVKSGHYESSDDTNPINAYGKSKLLGEKHLIKSGVKSLIIRTSWVFGALENNFVSAVLRKVKNGESLNVVDDQIGGPTSAVCLSKLLINLINNYYSKGELPFGVMHFCQWPYVSRYEFAAAIAETAFSMGLITTQTSITAVKSQQSSDIVRRPENSMLKVNEVLCEMMQSDMYWQRDLENCILNHFKN